ncbi:YggT family protein [Calidifontibacter indicus]|uniref:YggT family protein n=1 Tax=Calidifontibacter indicus TaxID=419650 RepID=A0A3D9UU70_9MICO|nr:YggT family protein [Calidifontibacter indicus]REF31500.1 YggT family protein [Calidifontibacter indicus]
MDQLRTVLGALLYLYFIILLARLVFDWIQVFARDWRPKGAVLVVAEGVYSLTDPPLKALRKVFKPLRIGQVRLDIAFLILMLGVSLLLGVIS